MAKTSVSQPEAEQRTDAWIKQYQDARAQFEQKNAKADAKARQVADDPASAFSKAALDAVAVVLGALAAFGGMTARRQVEVLTETYRGAATRLRDDKKRT